MARDNGNSLWGSLKVGAKMAIIPGLFIAAIAGILYYTVTTLDGLKSFGVVIDMAGRQRALTQRHTKEVLLVTQGVEMDHGHIAEIMRETQESLINGGPVLANLYTGEKGHLPAPPNETIRDEFIKEKKMLNEYLARASEFVKLKPADPTYPARLKELLDLNNKMAIESNESVKGLTRYTENSLNTMIRWEFGMGLMVGLLGIAFSWLITRAITGPLDQVVTRAKLIAAGNLRGDALAVNSSDQIGQLAVVFNHMVGSLKEIAGQTLAVTQNLTGASAQIMASTQEQAVGTKEQAATVQEITTTMEEVSQSGAQIVQKAKQVAAAAEATSTASNAGLRAVQDTTRTMGSIREQVEEVASTIVALSEKTLSVGETIATVNDIAERSNLLALNAAIEAAGAGEQGSRFSVVANEMKNLADQAKDSTVQVRTTLGDIQKGINSAVMFTEEAVKRVEAGRQQADIAEQTIRQMSKMTLESIQAFEQIIGASNQQQIGFEQVTQGMKDIRQAVGQTAAATSQLEQAVVNLNTLGKNLKQIVGRYQL